MLRAAAWLLAAPLAAAFGAAVDRYARTAAGPRTVVVPPPAPGATSFADGVIVSRPASPDEPLRVLSARCTHLGCLITHAAGDLLVCPCHGSRFRLDGTVVSGPAVRPLATLPYEVDPKTGNLVVHGA